MVRDLDHVVLNISKMADTGAVLYSLNEMENSTMFKTNSTGGNPCGNILDTGIQNTIIVEDFVVYGIMITFFTLVGVPLNILTILGFSRVKKLSSHTFLLQTLAGADTFFMLMVFVEYSLRTWYEVFGASRQWDVIFYHNFFVIKNFTGIASDLAVWMVVLVSADRYIAVYHPTRAIKFCQIKPAFIAVVTMFLYVMAFNFHNFFMFSIEVIGNETCHDHIIIHNTSGAYDMTYNMADSFINVVLPMLLVTLMDTRMIIALRRSKKRMGKRKDEASSTATVVLVVLATTFVLCEIPTAVEIFMRVFGETSYHYELSLSSTVFSVFNSFINFFIYILIGKTFRDALKAALFEFFCCGRKKKNAYYKTNTATTSMA
ncbi:FMRFamide receptor-like [Lineus longissimus]|uniref:FMRFamide receptor-like n=1 Tax=Lineus longissimus TaxID=88925 RepID=UPI002B4F19FF